jgi:penicillin amidase
LHGAWGSGYRAQRIHQVLGGGTTIDRADAIALQNDVKGTRAERVCPALVNRLGAASDSDIALLCSTLAAWDYRYTTDSAAATLFETFMDLWQSRVIAARFPERLHGLLHGQSNVAARLIERPDPDWFQGDMQTELLATARETVASVRQRLGEDTAAWQWQRVHQAHWRHPLERPEFDIGPHAVDGSGDTVRNTGMVGALGGAEYRIVVDFAEPDRFLAVQNIGNSGQPNTPHYADQFPAWLAGEYHTVFLERADVERDLESSTVLDPAGAVTA